MSTPAHPGTEKIIFRNTHRYLGRHISVTPSNSTNRHLSYGRIILNRSTPSVSFSNGNHETGLICLSGSGTLHVDGESFPFAQYDSIYIPRGSKIEVRTEAEADLAEFSAGVKGRYPLRFVPYEDISKDSTLKFTAGGPESGRQVSVCLGKNIEAGRLLLGFTVSDPGNWTSWPPHEHAKMLEEMYVYFGMPRPGYGIQLVYNDPESPELVAIVRDGDAVLMSAGYHPNVSVPGYRIKYLWAMAAHREKEDRQYGVSNVEPDFQPGSPKR
jgi:5-deoxy-glucuronate isomerase